MAECPSQGCTGFRGPGQAAVVNRAVQTGRTEDFAFPGDLSVPGECHPGSCSSTEKRQPDTSPRLLLKSPQNHEVSLKDLLVVATPAHLDRRPGRSHSRAVRDLCVQDRDT